MITDITSRLARFGAIALIYSDMTAGYEVGDLWCTSDQDGSTSLVR